MNKAVGAHTKQTLFELKLQGGVAQFVWVCVLRLCARYQKIVREVERGDSNATARLTLGDLKQGRPTMTRNARLGWRVRPLKRGESE